MTRDHVLFINEGSVHSINPDLMFGSLQIGPKFTKLLSQIILFLLNTIFFAGYHWMCIDYR